MRKKGKEKNGNKKKNRKGKRKKKGGRWIKRHHLQNSPCVSCSLGNSWRTGTATPPREHSSEGHGTRPPGAYCFPLLPKGSPWGQLPLRAHAFIPLLSATARCCRDPPGRDHRRAGPCSLPSPAEPAHSTLAPGGIYEMQVLSTLISKRSLQVLPQLSNKLPLGPLTYF